MYIDVPKQRPYREAMRPQISIETSRRLESLVEDLQSVPSSNLSHDEQVQFILEELANETYTDLFAKPPWDRQEWEEKYG